MKNNGVIVIVGLMFWACVSNDRSDAIEIIWKNNRAVAIIVAGKFDAMDTLRVRLANSKSQQSIFGSSSIGENGARFEPLIPFTRGLEYSVTIGNKVIGNILIPHSEARSSLLEIVPHGLVPENLLKIHLLFSNPMREGQSFEKVHLLDSKGDTLEETFLFMKSELWNEDRTLLTMWLDPGRIKRGLQPNRAMGSPLKHGEQYTLVIDSTWEDEAGTGLTGKLSKEFYVGARDSVSPIPSRWKINSPKGSAEPLTINLGEELDHVLVAQCISIVDDRGNPVSGTRNILIQNIAFSPDEPWKLGKYTIRVESRLEDLAGNNLNRAFDQNVKDKAGIKEFVELGFEVRE